MKNRACVRLAVVFVLLAVFCTAFFLGRQSGTALLTVQTRRKAPPQAAVSETGVQPAVRSAAIEQAPLLDLNTATQEELEQLPGIGPVLAQRIAEYREQVGRFVAREQLMDVSGIGEGIYAGLEGLITVEVEDENTGR